MTEHTKSGVRYASVHERTSVLLLLLLLLRLSAVVTDAQSDGRTDGHARASFRHPHGAHGARRASRYPIVSTRLG